MNRHVERVIRRREMELVRTWIAALITAAFVGFALAQTAHAQDISIGNGIGNAGYPTGAIPQVAANSGTTGGVSLFGLAGATAKFTYVCGFSVSSGTATAAINTTVTINFLTPSNITFTWGLNAPVTGAAPNNLTVNFTPCIPGLSTASSPLLSVSALGTGGAGQTAQIWGFVQ